MKNRDTFALAPDDYRKFRPRYPPELFEYLASLCLERRAALDCATGSGQAAIGLAELFDRVVAFDSSAEQIASAIAHPRIEYRRGDAERLPFEGTVFDLVVAAQAAHWFDLPAFYASLARVTRPGTVVAIWGYTYSTVDARIDALVRRSLLERIEPFWAEGNRVILDRYRTIPFPFAELRWRSFLVRNEWTREEYASYIRTWSAVRQYRAEHGYDPVDELERALRPIWPDATRMPVAFELVGRLGTVSGATHR